MEIIYKSKRLELLSIIAGFFYFLMIVIFFLNEGDNIKRSFLEGYMASDKYQQDSLETAFETHSFLVKASGGIMNFPDSLVNKHSGQKIGIQATEIVAALPLDTKSIQSKWLDGITTLLSFFWLFIVLYIPVQYYSLIKSLKKDIIFTKATILRIQRIGFSLISLYFLILAFNYLYYRLIQSIFQFSEYDIIKSKTELIWLVLGIVFLLIAEIISRGLKLKEEQELTI